MWGETLLCASVFLACVALARPVAETGFMDDWSYVRTAELLAQTGHIHYNGWATAMLGWPLYLAAAFIRVFGDSFTAVRGSMLAVATATVALLHRLCLRVGLNGWNSVLGTLSVALCPIFLIGSVVFLSDMPGLFAVLVCLYACLRALESEEHAAEWIAFAALSNAVLGTCRQIAWLGVLVMVPCTMWLLRRRRAVIPTGVVCVTGSAIFLWRAVVWFNAQPYSVAEHLGLHRIRHDTNVADLGTFLLRLVLDGTLLMLPVAFAFAPFPLRLPWRWMATVAAVVAVGYLLVWRHGHDRAYREWMSPFFQFELARPQSLETMFTSIQVPFKGPSPSPLTLPVRVGLTAVSLLGFGCLLGGGVYGLRRGTPGREDRFRMRELGVLIVPYLICYVGLLLPRGLLSFTYDRYFLLLLPPLLLLLLPWYQSRLRARVPGFCVALIGLVGVYSVVSLHDEFAAYRADLRLVAEVRAAGVPRTGIDAGWEFNHYTELLVSGVVLQPGARMRDGTILKDLHTSTAGLCSMEVPEWTPGLHPVYTVAYATSPCRLAPGFAPVRYRTWFPPFRRAAYVALYVPGSGGR